MLDQQQDILLAPAQRRYQDGDHIDAVEKILAEFAVFDHSSQITVGGDDDAGPHFSLRVDQAVHRPAPAIHAAAVPAAPG